MSIQQRDIMKHSEVFFPRSKSIILMLFLIATSLFAPNAKANRSRGSQQNPQVYEAEVDRLLKKNKSSCQQESDCVALKVGAMACGGPRKYLVVERATLGRVEREVSDLLAAIEELEKATHRGNRQVGICIANEEPKMACVEGSCVPAGPTDTQPASQSDRK